jgi:hypothetical protein
MPKTLRKRRKGMPLDPTTFIRQGGMLACEAKVAADAVAAERRFWLPVLQGWLRAGDLSPVPAAIIAVEVKRLRRALGLPPTVAHKRELNRLRVRAFRARQRQATIEQTEPEGHES